MLPDPMMLAQGMMGEAPAPLGAPMPPDPLMGAPMGAPTGAPSQFPSIDPMVIGELVMQVKGLQDADHMKLDSLQDTVLAAVLSALQGASADPMLGVTEGAALGVPTDDPMAGGGMY